MAQKTPPHTKPQPEPEPDTDQAPKSEMPRNSPRQQGAWPRVFDDFASI